METIFNYEWLNDIEDVYTNADTKEPEMILPQFNYPIRLGTSAYTGYIVTGKDTDTNEIISFNCDKIDLEEEVRNKTYLAMRDRFAVISNGVPFPRKNLKILSVTVPKELYKEIADKFLNSNNSLLWRIWSMVNTQNEYSE